MASLNTGIKIENLVITEGTDTNTTVSVNERVNLTWTWDASAANPVPGDWFEITFPDVLRPADPGASTPMMSGTEEIGTCVFGDVTDDANRLLRCTFSTAIIGKINLHGVGDAEAIATHTTTTNEVHFLINGESTVVDLPGGAPITNQRNVTGELLCGGFLWAVPVAR